jgi:hypothetical protein
MPDWRRVFLDIKMFAKMGLGGIMPEGQRLPMADLHEMRAWVMASLYWDASRDTDALVQEFLSGFYSAQAAPLVLEHMASYENFVLQTGAKASPCGCDVMSDACVTVEVLFTSFTALDTAMTAEAARNQTIVAGRLEALRISPYYNLMMRWSEACVYAKKNHVKQWPPLHNKTLGAAVVQWETDVKRLLSANALAQEQGWLASHRGSAQACEVV